MTKKKFYLVETEENEALLEKFIEAIFNGTCGVDNRYPNPYRLATGEKFLNSGVIKYFFQTRPFTKELYVDFFEKLRKLEPAGFNAYSYHIGQWIEERIVSKFFDIHEEPLGTSLTLKPGITLTNEEKDILSFLCYVAVCRIKFGASYETVTADRYFQIVTDLGSEEVKKMKLEGTGTLTKSLTEYKDDNVTCKANDVFATIKIKILTNVRQRIKKRWYLFATC